jgi:alpha-tubulin suppressor-like RCC1 family protein
VKCWGDNFVGELGNDSSDESHVPVDVSGLGSGASTVAVGTSHSCALMTSGGVKCWGLNFNGQLGDGGIVQLRRVPGDVVGLSGIAALASNGNTVCALTGAGGVKCWGANDSGQIGDNSITQRDAPVDVIGLTTGVAAIALGDSHACARLIATGAVCWGINTNGQLGNATTADSQVSVTVLQQTSAGPVISVNPSSIPNGTVGVVYPRKTCPARADRGRTALR